VSIVSDTSSCTLAAATYRYVVTAIMSGDSAQSNTSTKVQATLSSAGHITLRSNPVPSAASYRIYRGTSSTLASINKFFTSATTSFTDDGSSAGTAGTPP